MIYYDEIATLNDASEEDTTEELTEENTEDIATCTDALILEKVNEINTNIYNFYQVFEKL